MPIEPIEFRDRAAERRLLDLLEPAAQKLAQLGPEAVLVAQCPNKFNDAWYDDFWFAAQVGTAFWEAAHYIEDRPAPEINESGNEQGSKAVRAAREVLDALEAGRWREAAIACFGKKKGWQLSATVDVVFDGDVLCLALQYGQPWLCVVSSNGSTEIACTWTKSGLVHMARCERIDQYIGRTAPLRFRELRSDFSRHLRPDARTRLLPQIRHTEAAARLSKLLRESFPRMDGDTAQAERSDWLLTFAHDSYAFVDDTGWQYISLSKPSQSSSEDGSPRKSHLIAAVGHMEQGGWRQLFSQALGQASVSQLGLVHHKGELLLTWDLTAFGFMSGELRPVALCNDVVHFKQFELYDIS